MTEQTYQDMVARTDASGQIIVFQDNQTPTKSTGTLDYKNIAGANHFFENKT